MSSGKCIYFVPMIFHEIRWNTAIFCWLNPHFSYFPLPGWDNQKVPSSTESQGTTWFFWVFWRQLASARFVAGMGVLVYPKISKILGCLESEADFSIFLQIMDRLQWRHHNMNEKMVRIGVTIPMAELFRWIIPKLQIMCSWACWDDKSQISDQGHTSKHSRSYRKHRSTAQLAGPADFGLTLVNDRSISSFPSSHPYFV